jgi:hypothetical protein
MNQPFRIAQVKLFVESIGGAPEPVSATNCGGAETVPFPVYRAGADFDAIPHVNIEADRSGREQPGGRKRFGRMSPRRQRCSTGRSG